MTRAASPLFLPAILARPLEMAVRDLLHFDNGSTVNFLEPLGEEALFSSDSTSWRIFKNPVALFVGGIAAVLLELAEPRVRSGVWENSRFRSQPLLRMRRTGLAALATVYGPRSVSEEIIAHITRLHESIHGQTSTGQRYCASDPELLTWVHATATLSFFRAYSRYVCTLDDGDLDLFCGEALPAAALYGAINAPASHQEMNALFQITEKVLEPSSIIFDFLEIMQMTPILPTFFRPFQRMLVRAAVDVVPEQVRQRIGLAGNWVLMPWESRLVRRIGRISDKVLIQSNPAVQSCVRLGLSEDYLYQHAAA